MAISGTTCWILVDPDGGCWWIQLVDPGGSMGMIFMDPSCGSSWTHMVDPDEYKGGSLWFKVLGPFGCQ